jgi:hypothetical protein
MLLPLGVNAEENYSNLIVGKWNIVYKGKGSPVHTCVEFLSNGTFSYTSTNKGREDYEEHGKYKIEGDILYEMFSDEDEWCANKIWLLDPITLTIQEYKSNGELASLGLYSYQKVSPEPAKDINPLIYGKWERVTTVSYDFTHVTYSPDGTFSYTSTKNSSYEEHGTYRIEGDILYEMFSDEDEWSMNKILQLKSDFITIVELKEGGLSYKEDNKLSLKKVEEITNSSSSIEIDKCAYQTKPEIIGVNGYRTSIFRKGINIIKMSDGTIKKVILK